MSKIAAVKGREVLDSRGNPTVEVDVILKSDRENIKALTRLKDLHVEAGETQQAIELLLKVAEVSHARKDVAAALPALDQLLELDPKNARALELRQTLAKAAPPPIPHERGLIDDVGDEAAPQQGQQAVAVFGPQVMAHTGGQAAVQPVDAIQALHDPGAATAGTHQPGQVAHSAGQQDRLAGHFIQRKAYLMSAPLQPRSQFGLERGHTADIACPGNDANPCHVRIIPYLPVI